jgi:hypothetical protein
MGSTHKSVEEKRPTAKTERIGLRTTLQQQVSIQRAASSFASYQGHKKNHRNIIISRAPTPVSGCLQGGTRGTPPYVPGFLTWV